MEPVSANALGVEVFRDGIVIGQRIVAAVEGRIEAGNLRQRGEVGEERTDGRQIVRLVKRRQRDISRETSKDLVVDQHGPVVFRAAVDNTMPDRDRLEVLRSAQPVAGEGKGGRNIGNALGRDRFRRSAASRQPTRAAAAGCRCRLPVP